MTVHAPAIPAPLDWAGQYADACNAYERGRIGESAYRERLAALGFDGEEIDIHLAVLVRDE